MPKSVAILGCGPAGLLAAHAAVLMGNKVTILSKKSRSPMRGAQYMHRPIPGLDLPKPSKLAYVLHGEIDEYRRKVYGDDADEEITVSPELFVGYHEAWSIRQAYALLWKRYEKLILNVDITQEYLLHVVDVYDIVISTIPAQTLCYQDHQFNHVKVWIDSAWYGPDPQFNKERYGTNHVVVCNGVPHDPDHSRQTGWYRTSLIFNNANTEWAVSTDIMNLPVEARHVVKPLNTDCNCWPNIIRAGRYGSWKKGVLSHEAFELALEVL